MKSIDCFLNKMPSADYNCLNFAGEVWAYLQNDNRLKDYIINEKTTFKRLIKPSSCCIAIMHRKGLSPHIGIYIESRILHLGRNGVELEYPNTLRCFDRIGYYE